MVYLFFCPVIGSQVLLHGPCLESCDPLTLDCGGFQGLAASSTSKLLLSECQPFISVWCTKIYRNLFEWCTKKPGCPKHGQAGGSQAAALSRKFHCRRNSWSWRLSSQVSKKKPRQSISGFNYGEKIHCRIRKKASNYY